jgi:PDZ domain-containing protein
MTPILPEEEVVEPRPSRVGRWLVAALALVIAGVIAGSTVRLPYYAISPGGALDVTRLVRVEDASRAYPPKGAVLLCTVSLKHTSVIEAFQGWLDPNVDVVPQRRIVPPSSDAKRVERLNLQMMDTSKEQALAVAFEHLGYHSVTGKGARINEVVAGSPAHGVLKPGDTITAVDGNAVSLHTDAVRLLGAHKPGEQVALTIDPVGGGAARQVSVTLATNPDDATRPLLGVTLSTREPAFTFPYKVEIDSEGIGGPSAGLAFTLELLDILTPGELTGGRRVAATGTIELDGTVGEVGGVAQKTIAVRKAGAEVFLVPASELAEARAHAGRTLRVEPVRDVDDALRILAGLGGNGLALGQPGRDGA